MELNLSVVDEILSKYDPNPANLIPIMQEIQGVYKYLPREALEMVSVHLDLSISKIYGVATFYENFSLEAKGKYIIRCCDGTACHVRNSTQILKALREELGLEEKQHTTPDMLFTLETVSCLGACGLAPVMVINDDVYASVTVDKVKETIKALREKEKEAV
ncbi:MAG: NAD(P)H-dependent oxidoreductase subunit E [Lachnospiraceae bacterium]|nr:NAD(P)H-dependent oxidoreductase subunit E [Lachnospiraceae bacterium]